jgi:hypothetical protein
VLATPNRGTFLRGTTMLRISHKGYRPVVNIDPID